MNELLQPDERVLHEARGVVWLRSWLRRPIGRFALTNQRLLFEVPTQSMLGRANHFTADRQPSVPVDIPRDALAKVSRGMHRKSECVLVVQTEYEQFRFVVDALPEWEKIVRHAIHDDQAALQAVVEALRPKPVPPPYR